VFNDGAFAALTDKEVKDANQIRLESGRPIRFGVELEHGVTRGADGGLQIVAVDDVGEDALIVHDPSRKDPGLAFSLARLAEDPTGPTPIGIFRQVERQVYGRPSKILPEPVSDEELAELLLRGDTWSVGSTT
jgi:2-oxoglutarate ferredoxin oxidoreductase subunit beta